MSAVVNTPITVNAVVSNVANLGGFQFTLCYSTTLVNVQDIAMGDFLASTGRNVLPLGPSIDNSAGTATFGGSTLGASPPGPNGNGILARVRLMPLHNGTARLHFTGVQAVDIFGVNILLGTGDGVLHIARCVGDLDGNGAIDILDVQSVAGRWNTHQGQPSYDPRYDLDNDGDIDILDVQTVAGRWNTSCP